MDVSKLPWVQGLTEETGGSAFCRIASRRQLHRNQARSIRSHLSGLNFRQVNEVLEVINKGHDDRL
jgi:hypothetical protein